jgi:hypothetical protein
VQNHLLEHAQRRKQEFMSRMKTLLGILKRTWNKLSPDTKAKLIIFGPIVVAVLVTIAIGGFDSHTGVSKPASSISKPVTSGPVTSVPKPITPEERQRENARIMKIVDDWQAKHPPEQEPPHHAQEEPQPQQQPMQPRIVRIDVQCDLCQSYGKSVADAITTALQQSDKFDYAYLDMFVDAHVVVTERDGSVYVDLLTGTGTRRMSQNIATFRKSRDVLDASMIANAIYEYTKVGVEP